ncbi:hypothetical protein GGQ74_001997 [Desulfobaculum xiamenense]|uniref:Uncharacterized protein n=1 Tax=Desulfobaculum xiamenense TaxID=995050 RepID=A0A846QT21_9BACT|nr:hypothetical protein [Desulfobaculum xiamenense]NJB68324.1 hypothetical protein [Desulfobaculum xiamenense]
MFRPPMPPVPSVSVSRNGERLTLVERPIGLIALSAFFGITFIFGLLRLDMLADSRLHTGLAVTGAACVFCLLRGLTETTVTCDRANGRLTITRRILPTDIGRQASCRLSAIRRVIHKDNVTRHEILVDVDGDTRPLMDFRSALTIPTPPVADRLAAFLRVPLRREGMGSTSDA